MDREQERQQQEHVHPENDKGREPDNLQPWRDIFFRPRMTCRYLVRQETAGSATMMWLALTALIIVLLFLGIMLGTVKGDAAAAKMRLVLITPILFLVMGVFFVAESYMLWQSLRLFGGKAELDTVKIVFSFTQVIPTAVFIIISIVLAFVIPKSSLLAALISNAIVGWMLYITLAGLAELSRISAWRALAAYLLTMVVWAGIFYAITAIIGVTLPAAGSVTPKFPRLT